MGEICERAARTETGFLTKPKKSDFIAGLVRFDLRCPVGKYYYSKLCFSLVTSIIIKPRIHSRLNRCFGERSSFILWRTSAPHSGHLATPGLIGAEHDEHFSSRTREYISHFPQCPH